MKQIDHILWACVDNKIVLIVGDEYKGSPMIKFEYDVLIVSKNKYNQYKDNLIFQHDHLDIKKPKILFLD